MVATIILIPRSKARAVQIILINKCTFLLFVHTSQITHTAQIILITQISVCHKAIINIL
jgi:hypothetical protein